jgi:hypothetical protein
VLNIPGSISVYPNPVVNKEVNIVFANEPAGTYKVELTNKLGQVLYRGKVDVKYVKEKKKVSLANVTAAGLYRLNILALDGSVNSVEILVE